MRLSDEIVHFFHAQGCVIVTTITKEGTPHNSCKGIVEITRDGAVYLLDLYWGRTFANLTSNPAIGITALDEHKFKGFSLVGRARIVKEEEFSPQIRHAWEERMTFRITQRVLRNIAGSKGHPRHPEAVMPQPKYMIMIEVDEVIDLTPHHLKGHAQNE